MKHRRAIFLDAMGLGPQWTLRAPLASAPAQADVAPEAAEVVDAVDAVDAVQATQVTQVTVVPATPAAPADWPALHAAIQACQACTRCAQRREPVLGSGDTGANWLFIAEAPDADEDAQGAPLVGAAGRLFDNMLAALSLRLGENVYLTHAVKCHGSADADAALAACRAHLQSQVALLQPKVIIAFGSGAASALVPGARRGAALRYGEIPLVVTHAPAQLLREPASKRDAWADLCQAWDLITHA